MAVDLSWIVLFLMAVIVAAKLFGCGGTCG